MAAGYPLNPASISHRLGQVAVALRDACTAVARFQRVLDSLGTDDTARETALVAMGYTADDAHATVLAANYMANVSGVYFGTVYQGDPPILFDFDNALAGTWGVG